MIKHLSTFLIFSLLAAISGCTPSYAPVEDKYGAVSDRGPVTRGVHVVRPGETLYSIAWRYGWDFKALAAANNVRAPYTIFPGQQIRLDQKVAAASRPAPVAPKPSPTRSTPASSSSSSSKPTPAPVAKPTPRQSSPSVATGPVKWQWPATGNIISRYSSATAGQHGISIDGRDGDPVVAAADGVVVYRGDGLTGYGNLLIIKHDERWLSAYAHNQKMLVKEGQAVKAGSKIATMGASGTFRTQLHFEVRRDGSPIDPMTVLPRN